MSRCTRAESPTGLYHVMVRGAGKQILFEDDRDYARFISRLEENKTKSSIDVVAYCLMNNHVHLLVKADTLDALSTMMRRLGTSYATYYNKKYEHCGNVFQGRFKSKIIESETSLLRCTRYIHNNPVKANFGSRDEYPWSSYHDYISGGGMTDTALVLGLVGEGSDFAKFSKGEVESDPAIFDVDDVVTIKTGNEIIRRHLENELEVGTIVKKLGYEERNTIIRSLKDGGLSNRQIELITGVSQGKR